MANNIVNLIRKDFGALWSERTTGRMFVALLVMSAIFASSRNFSSLVFVLLTASTYILNVFNLEEKFRTERFFASLPVRRRDIVLARYGGVLAIAGAYFALAYLANAAAILAGKTDARPIPLGYCASVLAMLALITSFPFPLYFKFGVARAKTITTFVLSVVMGSSVLILFSPSGAANRVMKAISAVLSPPFSSDSPYALPMIGAAILLWGVSIPLAVALYLRKDL